MKQLKAHIYNDVKKNPLCNLIATTCGVSEQSIRLWSRKRDIRLLYYPVMVILAEHYNCMIPDLMEIDNTPDSSQLLNH